VPGRPHRFLVVTAAALAMMAQPAGAAVLHDQFAPAEAGRNVNSQNFEPALDTFDDLGADDFVVPAATVWRIDHIEIAGESTGSAATTANVFLFGEGGTLPGAQLFVHNELPIGAGLTYPDLDLAISDFPILGPGRYWIGVQANRVFNPGVNNFWWRDHAPQVGQPAAWRQPGNGFGDGCTSFVTRHTCPSYSGSADVPDQAFRLSGESASSAFSVTKVKRKRRGKVKLKVNAPNVGELVATSVKLKTVRHQVTRLGTNKFVMRAKAKTRRRLADGRRVRAKINLTMTGLLGETLTTSVKVKLRA
jgi:hypothetical protein